MSGAWDPRLYEQRHSFVWQLGAELLDWIEPRAGERILDLGCGTGQLTARIAESGAEVVGLDNSQEMVALARAALPNLQIILADAARFRLDQPFDAVFSNAVLHWVKEASAAACSIAAALRPGGRFVAEFGGKGNCRMLLEGLRVVAARHGYRVESPWYFPSIADYTKVLEEAGLDAADARLFDRDTQLEGIDGLRNWLRMFGQPLLAHVPAEARERFLAELETELRPRLFRGGQWFMDYRRLRVKAFRR